MRKRQQFVGSRRWSLAIAVASALVPLRLHAADEQASDNVNEGNFGISASQSGTIGLVGAGGATGPGNVRQGAAYVFRSLDTASGTLTQTVKLIASDGAAGNNLGQSVSESGTIGLAGAYQATVGSNTQQGAAYVFRNLDTATGTVTQNVKLTASDGASKDFFWLRRRTVRHDRAGWGGRGDGWRRRTSRSCLRLP